MRCPKCKTQHQEDASFCQKCGEEFSNQKSAPATKGSYNWCIKALLIFLVLAVIAVIAIPTTFEFSSVAWARYKKEDILTIAAGLEAYYVDHGAYPAWSADDESLNGAKHLKVLTTPVSYLSSIPRHFDELFQPVSTSYGRSPFKYYSTESSWILWCSGPDYDYDLDHAFLIDIVKFGESEEVFQLHDFCYDPTNGNKSSGDIYRVGGEAEKYIKPGGWK